MKLKAFAISLLGLSALSVLTGCASTNSQEMASSVNQEVRSTTSALTAPNRRVVQSRVVDSSFIGGKIVDFIAPERGSITMNVVGQPMFAVLQSLAEQSNYTASVTSEVDPMKRITIDLRNVTHEQALRDVAAAAGYIAVLDQARRTVTVTETASFTFRLPSRLFNDSVASTFNVSSNPGGGGGGGAGGAGSLAAASNASVTGGSIKHGAKVLTEYIQSLAGPNAEVKVLPDAGIITVRTKAQQLRRIHQALTDYARFALTQVELEVTMMEVSLTGDMSSGVDWSRLIANSGSPLTIGLTTAGNVANASMSVQYTGASIQSLVNLLEQNTNARTLARQRFPAFNNTVSIMFDGKKVPYIGKIEQSVSGTAGTTSTAASFDFAMDGISTAVYTNVLDNNQVELTLMPVLSSIEGFETASIGGNTITAPIQPLRQGHFPFIGRHGKTLVFGGGRFGRESNTATGIPGVAGTMANRIFGSNAQNLVQKELVFLVNTRIIPMTNFEPLIRESI